jgi:hypothetical protein
MKTYEETLSKNGNVEMIETLKTLEDLKTILSSLEDKNKYLFLTTDLFETISNITECSWNIEKLSKLNLIHLHTVVSQDAGTSVQKYVCLSSKGMLIERVKYPLELTALLSKHYKNLEDFTFDVVKLHEAAISLIVNRLAYR